MGLLVPGLLGKTAKLEPFVGEVGAGPICDDSGMSEATFWHREGLRAVSASLKLELSKKRLVVEVFDEILQIARIGMRGNVMGMPREEASAGFSLLVT